MGASRSDVLAMTWSRQRRHQFRRRHRHVL